MKILTVENNLEKYGIEVIAPGNANFDNKLKQYIEPNDNLLRLVEAVKPLAVFVRNNSTKEIVGISLRWNFTKSDGTSQSIPQIQSNPGVLEGIKPVSPTMLGKTSIVNGNAERFFCFDVNVEGEIVKGNMRARNSGVKNKHILGLGDLEKISTHVGSQTDRTLKDISNVSVSVDGVFFSDGTFLGDDKNFYFESMRGRLEARRNFITNLHQAKLGGKEDGEILAEFLRNTPETISRPSDTEVQMHYVDGEQAFNLSYKAALVDLRKEISFKKLRISDNSIVESFRSVTTSDFVTLHKAD